MMTKCFSVFDKAAMAFLPPFFMPARGMAIRSFTDAVNDPAHQFGKSRNFHDFALYELSEFDDTNGHFVSSSEHPVRLALATDVLDKS